VNVLDLFSGIGGFSLGLERAGFTTVAFCEIDPYARAVLRKHWPDVPCYGDIHEVTAGRLDRDGVGRIDLVCGGYPCQPFSHAGQQRGHEDPRHLWPQMRRVIGEVRPAWVVAENVAGHIALGLDQVLADLEADGYAGRAIVVPACAVDAPHIRQRVWIMARDRDRDRESALPIDAEVEGVQGDLADADKPRLEGRDGAGVRERADELAAGAGGSSVPDAPSMQRRNEQRHESGRVLSRDGVRSIDGHEGRRKPEPARWLPEPDVGRVAHGIPSRVDRLRCLGNAVVPQVVEVIGRAIMAADKEQSRNSATRTGDGSIG
jgi:DNA (cytosine-5)-methyltransferase 1